MEDLDRDRVVPGSADEILRCLEACGLFWDGQVEYQSRRTHRYAAALEFLRATGLTFECSCSRRERDTAEEFPLTAYPGTCRHGPKRRYDTATRFRINELETIEFEDRFQGPITIRMSSLGDPVVRRRDGVFAYQLAVVVDDAAQQVTDVVRGADLLDSTGWQMALQRALVVPIPGHAHLPLLVEPTRGKLAKSRRSVALYAARAGEQLISALRLLGQAPPGELDRAPPTEILAWAVLHWQPLSFRLRRQIALPPTR